MQELSLKSGGGHKFGRGRNLGRVYVLHMYRTSVCCIYNYSVLYYSDPNKLYLEVECKYS